MTFKNSKSVSFGKFFGLFYKYWDYASKRETQYTAFEVIMLTNVIYMDLRIKWENEKWEIEELKYICHALNNNCKDIDPQFFANQRFAYLDHLKTWYYLERNNG